MAGKEIGSFIDIKQLKIDEVSLKNLQFLYQVYLDHRFDLLGSGPVKVDYNVKAKGVHGRVYYGKYKKKPKVADYDPINWFCDYKSGFVFEPSVYNSKKACENVIGKKKSVEIKIPWELGRLYHLPQVAICSVFDQKKRKSALVEFKNEVLDFINNNPIGKTVQWSAPMDVGIRCVNLLIAYDIFKQIDAYSIFTDDFEKRVYDLILSSGIYVMNHLEYIGKISANHYLSNLVSMIFISSYLPASKQTDAWLVFSTQELIEQVKHQYYTEGGHFEGSTSYHRLSTEFVVFGMALVLGISKTDRRKAFSSYDKNIVDRLKSFNLQEYCLNNQEFFPTQFLEKILNAGIFTSKIMKTNGQIPQVGDNDSGRLLKLSPRGIIIPYNEGYNKYANLPELPLKEYFDEDILAHDTLLSLIGGLYDKCNELHPYAEQLPLESSIIKCLSKNTSIAQKSKGDNEKKLVSQIEVPELLYENRQIFYGKEGEESIVNEMDVFYFEKFGVLIYKSTRVYLCITVDTSKNAKYKGHTHNDKLSIELELDGDILARDPGGYLYTSAPDKRDLFRSTKVHSGIYVEGIEQDMLMGTFEMKGNAKGYVIDYSKESVRLYATYNKVKHYREINIRDNSIEIIDKCNYPFHTVFNKKLYSNGYGRLLRNPKEEKKR